MYLPTYYHLNIFIGKELKACSSVTSKCYRLFWLQIWM